MPQLHYQVNLDLHFAYFKLVELQTHDLTNFLQLM